MTLGGRKVAVGRPRVVAVEGGGEIGLDSWPVFSSRDLLSQVALEQIPAGVATCRHGAVAEPIGAGLTEKAGGTPARRCRAGSRRPPPPSWLS